MSPYAVAVAKRAKTSRALKGVVFIVGDNTFLALGYSSAFPHVKPKPLNFRSEGQAWRKNFNSWRGLHLERERLVGQ